MEKKTFDNLGETLFTETLPNGLKISILPRENFNKSYAVFATNYGGADRRFKLSGEWIDTPAGVAHFLEHKVFDMPGYNALSALSANGAAANAFTSSGMTAYYFDCTESFYDNLRELLSFVSTPYFSAESVEKEQGIIGQEIRMVEDSPGFVIYNELMRCLYEHNPIRDSVAGTIDSISKISEKTLYHCHEVFYNPSNMALAVVGNVDPEKIVQMAKDILPNEPGEVPERDYGAEESALPHKAEVRNQMEVSAPQFLFGTRFAPAEGNLCLRQKLVGSIALNMLFGRSSPTFNLLYSGGLLNGEFEYELDYTADSATVLVGGESRNIKAVMDEFSKELSRIATDGLDQILFESTKKSMFGDALRTLASFSAVGLSLIEGSFKGYCPMDSFELLESISADEVLSFINENIRTEKIALSVVEPKN